MKSYAQRMKKPQTANPQQSPAVGAPLGNQAMAALIGYDASKSKSDPALEDKMRTKLQKQFQHITHNLDETSNLPANLKECFEQRFGYSLDDVHVHYDSSLPSQFHANALTRGNDIFVAPGKEESIPHELGHIVQDKQGYPAEKRAKLSEVPYLEKSADQNAYDAIYQTGTHKSIVSSGHTSLSKICMFDFEDHYSEEFERFCILVDALRKEIKGESFPSALRQIVSDSLESIETDILTSAGHQFKYDTMVGKLNKNIKDAISKAEKFEKIKNEIISVNQMYGVTIDESALTVEGIIEAYIPCLNNKAKMEDDKKQAAKKAYSIAEKSTYEDYRNVPITGQKKMFLRRLKTDRDKCIRKKIPKLECVDQQSEEWKYPTLKINPWSLAINDAFIGGCIDQKVRIKIDDISDQTKKSLAYISENTEPKQRPEKFLELCKTDTALKPETPQSFKYTVLAREIMQLLNNNWVFRVFRPKTKEEREFYKDRTVVLQAFSSAEDATKYETEKKKKLDTPKTK